MGQTWSLAVSTVLEFCQEVEDAQNWQSLHTMIWIYRHADREYMAHWTPFIAVQAVFSDTYIAHVDIAMMQHF